MNNDDHHHHDDENYSGTISNTIQQQSGIPPILHRIQQSMTMPICIIFVGMAGSGKSSLIYQLQSSLDQLAASTTTTTATNQQEQEPQQPEQKNNTGIINTKDAHTNTTETTTTTSSQSTTTTTTTMNYNNSNHKIPIPYCINLDPATIHLLYDASIDIRDTINYQQIMEQYHQYRLSRLQQQQSDTTTTTTNHQNPSNVVVSSNHRRRTGSSNVFSRFRWRNRSNTTTTIQTQR